ncbi:hypothetical protein [Candidatus Endoriftia persephonae]|jgi:hypothetical protein|uniref:Uncharacterized protein n=1 Tax=Candidatus Endoriftia persephonae TaxID=393765 RepID=A0A9J6ZUC7_9GAMM|nr:hypothetical protein [Candidatus Endoriftia persephone]USF86388.1 hypothetical protein L0Y14_09545 [Candidatus Endoriftia persephone]
MSESKNQDNGDVKALKVAAPRFCQDCGLSLVMLDTWCTSRACPDCGKEVYFIRPGEDGGIKVEAGEKFHVPQLTMSLDPTAGMQFTRYGLQGFLKQLFLEQKISSEAELVRHYKDTERRLDADLNGLDCISHCDLETAEGVEEAVKILQSNGLIEHQFNLLRSGLLREAYTAVEEGDAPRAALAAHQANVFKEYSLLEHHHLKEILWLGYRCYQDMVKNEGLTENAAKEQKLMNGVVKKLREYGDEFLYALSHDGREIGPRVSVSGVAEKSLKALIEHELQHREQERAEIHAKEELKIKKMANSIKLWGFLFTLANALILAQYKDWLG